MKKYLIPFLAITLIHTSCFRNRNMSEPGEMVSDSINADAALPDMKKVNNERFGFEFSIPENWGAIDSSANGDGYFIDAGNHEVDLRIYAEIIPEGHSMDIIAPQCDSLANFTFDDGLAGKICDVNPREIFIFRDNADHRISFFVQAPESWIESNKALITAIAKSLSFRKLHSSENS